MEKMALIANRVFDQKHSEYIDAQLELLKVETQKKIDALQSAISDSTADTKVFLDKLIKKTLDDLRVYTPPDRLQLVNGKIVVPSHSGEYVCELESGLEHIQLLDDGEITLYLGVGYSVSINAVSRLINSIAIKNNRHYSFLSSDKTTIIPPSSVVELTIKTFYGSTIVTSILYT
jgi:hypothetical protein